jgi:hypothetical protein
MTDKSSGGDGEKGFSAFSSLVSDVATDISDASTPPPKTTKSTPQPADIDAWQPIYEATQGAESAIQKHLRNRHVQIALGITAIIIAIYVLNRPSNFYECILDDMPGVRNNIAARKIMLNCRKEFPDAVIPEDKSSLGGSARDCVVKHGKSAVGEIGSNLIRRSCYAIYPNK